MAKTWKCGDCGNTFTKDDIQMIIPDGETEYQACNACYEKTQLVTHRYTIDCWYKDDGRPLVRHIDATNEEEAERLFKEQNPLMDCDTPYIYE